MKKIFLCCVTVVWFVLHSTCLADMQIVFNNRVGTVVQAPINRPDGSGAGVGVKAQLVLVKNDGSFSPVGDRTVFRTNSAAAAYFVVPTNVTIPGIQQREKVTLRLRAWEGKEFDTSTLRGESESIQLSNNGVANSLVGLKGFTLKPATPGAK